MITTSPGRANSPPIFTSFSTKPIPAVEIKTLSALPFWATLVSPAMIKTPASCAVCCMEKAILSRSLIGKPSSSIKEAVIKQGMPPDMLISLTVPAIANRPISPPGKKMGSIMWLSVETTILWSLKFSSSKMSAKSFCRSNHEF